MGGIAILPAAGLHIVERQSMRIVLQDYDHDHDPLYRFLTEGAAPEGPAMSNYLCQALAVSVCSTALIALQVYGRIPAA